MRPTRPRPLAALIAGILSLMTALFAYAQSPPRVSIALGEEAEIVEKLPLTGTLTAPQSALLASEVEG